MIVSTSTIMSTIMFVVVVVVVGVMLEYISSRRKKRSTQLKMSIMLVSADTHAFSRLGPRCQSRSHDRKMQEPTKSRAPIPVKTTLVARHSQWFDTNDQRVASLRLKAAKSYRGDLSKKVVSMY
jgi:hypothetical protein